jgi:hypothetical protein
MKYLKRFESAPENTLSKSHTFNVGDYVKCIKDLCDDITLKDFDVKVNDVYIVSELLYLGTKIMVFGFNRWYYPNYFKLITKEEYEMNKNTIKYNL